MTTNALNQSRLYVIGVPFSGAIESTVTVNEDGSKYVDLSGYLYNQNKGNLTLDEYLAHPHTNSTAENSRVVDDETLDRVVAEYYLTLVTDATEITRERFDDLFECLPPSKWRQRAGFDVFHMCERITGRLVTWVAQDLGTGKCYSFDDFENIDDDAITVKLLAASK